MSNVTVTIRQTRVVVRLQSTYQASAVGGDMTKAQYDGNNDGKVNASDNADKLNAQTPAYYLDRDNHTGMQAQVTIEGSVTGQTLADDIATLYAEVASQIELGNTSITAYRGDHGLAAYTHSQATGNPHDTGITDISGLSTALNQRAIQFSALRPVLFSGVTAQPANTNHTVYVNGELVTLIISPDDQSPNSNFYTIALPYTSAAGSTQNYTVTCKNAGSIVAAARIEIPPNSNIAFMRISHSASLTGWSTTGFRNFYGTLVYRRNINAPVVDVYHYGDSKMSNGDTGSASLQYGWGISNIVNNLITGNRPASFNIALPGATTQSLTTDYTNRVRQYVKPGDIMFLRVGINNARAGETAAQIDANVRALCQLIRADGVIVVYVGLTPGQFTTDPANTSANALAANALMVANTSFCDRFINLALEPEFNDVSDITNILYYQPDQLHEKTAAQAIVGNRMYNVLTTLL
jgi:hypothetical protein